MLGASCGPTDMRGDTKFSPRSTTDLSVFRPHSVPKSATEADRTELAPARGTRCRDSHIRDDLLRH
jgi:hypothetical protein